MTLRLAGSTSGYTEIDAPAVAGSNTLVLPASNGSAGQLLKNGSTAGSLEFSSSVSIDSSNRLLVGTSSTSASALLTVQGSSSAAAGAANINIQRGTAATSIVADNVIGQINFGDSSANAFANISCSADANAGTNDYPGRLTFSTTADGASSPTERMRIENTGACRTYSTGTNTLNVANSNASGTSQNLFVGSYGATGNGGGTASIVISNNGNVQNANNSYTALSDIKLKENIVDANSQWGDLKALRVRNYNLKEGQIHTQIGLVAQEVELISPGLVYETPDRDKDGKDLGSTTKVVQYSVLYMKAVKALQEAMERIEQLEAKVAVLESA